MGPSSDRTPPTVSLLSPPNDSDIPPTPLFALRLSDETSGVLSPTIVVRLNGTDFSEEFGNAFDPQTGELRVRIGPLEIGAATLVVTVLDRAGNQGTATFRFSVIPETEPPPPPPT